MKENDPFEILEQKRIAHAEAALRQDPELLADIERVTNDDAGSGDSEIHPLSGTISRPELDLNPWNRRNENFGPSVSPAEVQAFMAETPTQIISQLFERRWPESPAPEAFQGLAGDFVKVVLPHTEADPIALLSQFLVFFGNAIGHASYFTVEADQHTANINAILVGDTASGRKGASLSQTRRPFRLADPVWADARIQSGLSSG